MKNGKFKEELITLIKKFNKYQECTLIDINIELQETMLAFEDNEIYYKIELTLK